MTFSADKSVSALWAVADPELRAEIERAHNDAARVALEETVLRHCAYTRIRNRVGGYRGAARLIYPPRCSSMEPAGTTTRSFTPTA